MRGTATATPTARLTTSLTASAHGTPGATSSRGGGEAGFEGARDGPAGGDWEASEVQREVDMAGSGGGNGLKMVPSGRSQNWRAGARRARRRRRGAAALAQHPSSRRRWVAKGGAAPMGGQGWGRAAGPRPHCACRRASARKFKCTDGAQIVLMWHTSISTQFSFGSGFRHTLHRRPLSMHY